MAESRTSTPPLLSTAVPRQHTIDSDTDTPDVTSLLLSLLNELQNSTTLTPDLSLPRLSESVPHLEQLSGDTAQETDDQTPANTTHIHRPLDSELTYIELLTRALALQENSGYSGDEDEPPLPNWNTDGTPVAVDFDHTVQRLEQELEHVVIRRSGLQTTAAFIRALKEADLDESKMLPEAIARMRDPMKAQIEEFEDEEGFKFSLDTFLGSRTAPDATYKDLIKRHQRSKPWLDLWSLHRMENRVRKLAGTSTIVHDMCLNTCCAYTGPFKDFDSCPICNTSRWKTNSRGKQVAAQTFTTISIGPQLQALYAGEETAKAMRYRQAKTEDLVREFCDENGDIDVKSYGDIFDGSAYLESVANGGIKDDDILLLLSIDGAQLYEHRESDCWIFIWVILDLAPGNRYKKRYVIPGGFIPGPHKPKHVDSFLFPALYHISALQKEGLRIWDASRNLIINSRPLLFMATADAPGMVYLSGLVGHSGARGCRKYCKVPSRLKPDGSHYYPVLHLPNGLSTSGSTFPDIQLDEWDPYFSQKEYTDNLISVLSTESTTQYELVRRTTGISKPSLLMGLHLPLLGAPGSFPLDTMHLLSLNIPDLILSLWRGTMKCDSQLDNKSTWDWVVLQGAPWREHGKRVASFRKYLPSSYERPPRNPAEKLNSGYKATEFNTYVYGFLPILLRDTNLPEKYLQNFYRLVRGVRLILQRTITSSDAESAHKLFITFLNEFEESYVQRRPERMHFVRQCMHTLWHLVPEMFRFGPPCTFAQWTIERTIGNLGQEIRLHSNAYANLAERGVLRATLSGFYAKYPHYDSEVHLPKGSILLSGGFLLLRPADDFPHIIRDDEQRAITSFLLSLNGSIATEDGPNKVTRYARLKLPNGQIARTAWKEDNRADPRISRMVKVCYISYKY